MDNEYALTAPAPTRESITERLKREKRYLEMRLQDINTALESLEKQPEIAQVINTLSKTIHF